ncbi:MAG: hypothetical protein KF757_04200 [Phycisphaeraceae bacterium]|nr:hypothetical protein [Phycisphaeraceae bacterium]MCW5763204.1 hypothetical protein [Phycisphaeraceae bacterium]
MTVSDADSHAATRDEDGPNCSLAIEPHHVLFVQRPAKTPGVVHFCLRAACLYTPLMLLIGCVLLGVGVILLVASVRGRVTVRGEFCRGCRFDLAGTPTVPDRRCPECGREITAIGSTRPVLRRVSRGGVVAAAVVLLLGSLLMAAALGVRNVRLLALLPDGTVVMLAERGVDEAVGELAARSLRSTPMSAEHWKRAIDLALAHQADESIAWDPRYGDVLAAAAQGRQMDEEQLRAYFEQGMRDTVVIRSRVSARDVEVPYLIANTLDRMSVQLSSQHLSALGLQANRHRFSSGVVGQEATAVRRGGSTTGLWLPAGGSSATGSVSSAIPVTSEAWAGGDEVRLYVEYDITIERPGGGALVSLGTRRHEQVVRLLPPGTPVVEFIKDATLARAVQAAAGMSHIEVVPIDLEDLPRYGVEVVKFWQRFDGVPAPIAGRLFVLHDGVETEVVRFSSEGGRQGGHIYGQQWSVTHDGAAEAAALASRWADAGRVDVIFRPDPRVGENHALLDTVLDVTLVFEGVEVVRVEVPSSSSPGNYRPARVDE